MKEEIKSILKSYNLNMMEVERHKINANGVLVLSKYASLILIDKELNDGVKLFVLLHEIGHIEQDYVNLDPRKNKFSDEIEKKCDQWAIQFLSNFLPQEDILKLNELIELKQRELYEFISKNRAFDELWRSCKGHLFETQPIACP